MSIQYLAYRQIDFKKWDRCIDIAGNGLIYGYSFYLNSMAKQWDALVLNDYEAIMPLTWNKKYGIHYLYQPAFTASLGIFGNTLSAGIINDFLNAVPEKFRYWDIYLNHSNNFKLPNFIFYERLNKVLPLHEPYENLFNGFRESTKRNIRKAIQLNCIIKKDISVNEVIRLAKEQSASFDGPSVLDFENIEKLYNRLHLQQKAVTYGVYSDLNLVASAAFFFSHNRAYYILVGNHPNGKTIGASHLLINTFIKDHAGQNIILDFEGSDIPKLAFFYNSFGAVDQKYTGIRLNRLPPLLKWFKKN